MLITPILGTISSKESRDYVDTVTLVAAYAWHADFITNIYYMAAASNASESGDVLSEEPVEPTQIDKSFMDAFIANAVGNSSERVF